MTCVRGASTENRDLTYLREHGSCGSHPHILVKLLTRSDVVERSRDGRRVSGFPTGPVVGFGFPTCPLVAFGFPTGPCVAYV